MHACMTMLISTYTSDEWDAHRPLIERLYLERSLTMRQVCSELRNIGFLVNTRMVKARIVKWSLHKKLHLPEMCTALEMLGPDRSRWPVEEPQFRIGRRVFTLQEILRSYGRRGIQDPLKWIQTNPNASCGRSSHVELLTPSTGVSSDTEGNEIDPTATHSAYTKPNSLSHGSCVDSLEKQDGRQGIFYGFRLTYAESSNEVPRSLQDPEIDIYTATAVHQMKSYCRMYMASAQSVLHQEPVVHHLTIHARFLDHMDEGMALFARNRTEMAFANFQLGFAMLRETLVDLHPMATAIYLLLLCKLTASRTKDVAFLLLKHTFELASASVEVPSHWLTLLRAILKSGQYLEVPLLCLRAASGVLEAKDHGHWKTLYVKERHCDALYYTQRYGEGAERRSQLLKLQESKYGPSARNVLWTALNVADDHLVQGQLLEADRRFCHVLVQSEQHSGYNRVKSRVVALEGLAKVSYMNACKQLQHNQRSTPQLQSLVTASKQLGRALELIDEAIELAKVWFNGLNRRMERFVSLRGEIRAAASSLDKLQDSVVS